MKVLDIGVVAEQARLPASTIRYYEEIGLITSISRHGLRRQFGEEVMVRLALIAMGKAAGFTLTDIAGMFGRDGQPDLPRGDLLGRAKALDQQIRELGALRDALRHVAECKAPSHMQCPTFQRMVRLAGKRVRRKASTRALTPR